MGKPLSLKIRLKDGVDTSVLFGQYDSHLRMLEDAFEVRLVARGDEVQVEGEAESVKRTEKVLNDLTSLVGEGVFLRPEDVGYAIKVLQQNPSASVKEAFLDTVSIPTKKKFILPKSPAQKKYVEAIRAHDIVIGIGPAGTGKTYLAMAMAVSSYTRKEVSRIILARPAVEAGEKLGYLPGDIHEKINPYLRPLYDALYDMMEVDRANRMMERGEIEIAPLAYMRGRTLNNSFIILDEAQNSTAEQMKMFLTRLGFDSKCVITGDITQVDLPTERPSGLIQVQGILAGIQGIAFVYFSEKDVVRHKLVQEIIKAYDRHEASVKRAKKTKGN